MPRYRNININIYRVDRSRFRRMENPTLILSEETADQIMVSETQETMETQEGSRGNNGNNNNSGFRNENNGGFRNNSEGGFRGNSDNGGNRGNADNGGFRNNNGGGFRGNSEVRREAPKKEKIMDSEEIMEVSDKNLKILHQDKRTVVMAVYGFRGSLVRN